MDCRRPTIVAPLVEVTLVVLCVAVLATGCGSSELFGSGDRAASPQAGSGTAQSVEFVESAGTDRSSRSVDPASIIPDASELTSSLDPIEASVLGERETSETDEELRRSAIDHLTRTGRSAASATCIVDRLIAIGQIELLEDAQFGMGLDPLEADALAGCL